MDLRQALEQARAEGLIDDEKWEKITELDTWEGEGNLKADLLKEELFTSSEIEGFQLEVEATLTSIPKEPLDSEEKSGESTETLDRSETEISLDNSEAETWPAFSPSPDGETPTHFAHYKIEGELGRGGMGVVYKAFDTRLDRRVALKIIPPHLNLSSANLHRFQQEAKALARLKHPHIVEVFDVHDSPPYYFTMEFIEGEDLSGAIRRGDLAVEEVVDILEKSARALHAAHEKGIYHRDIKPANIMLDREKGPKVMDFGLAKIEDSEITYTQVGDIIGTPAYMSPEQTYGKGDLEHTIDWRTDIYSLGVAMYHALTGIKPFEGKHVTSLLLQIQRKEPVPPRRLNPDIPVELEAICLKAMEKKAESRYQSAGEMAEDLVAYRENRPIIAQPPNWWTGTKKFVKRNLLLTSMVSTLLVAILLGTAVSLIQWQRAEVNAEIAAERAERARSLAVQAQKSEEKAQEQMREATRLAQRNMHLAKHNQSLAKKSIEEAWNTRYRLVKITLAKAREFCENQKWADGGSLATTVLKLLKGYDHRRETPRLRRQALGVVRAALFRRSLIWQTYRYGQGMGMALYRRNKPGVITAGANGRLQFWDYPQGTLERKSAAIKSRFRKLAQSPRGKWIATLTRDQRLTIWNGETGAVVRQFESDENRFMRWVAFGPQEKRLAVIVNYRNIWIWNIEKGEVEKVFTSKKDIYHLAFHPDGKRLAGATSNKYVPIWNLETGKVVKKCKDTYFAKRIISYSPDGKWLAAAQSRKRILLWNLAQDKLKWTFTLPASSRCTTLQFHPKKPWLLTGDNRGVIRKWDLDRGKLLEKFDLEVQTVTYLDIAPKGDEFIAGHFEGRVRRCRIDPIRELHPLRDPVDAVYSIAAHPSRPLVAVSTRSGQLNLMSTDTGQTVRRLSNTPGSPSYGCAFSPDGKWVVAGGKEGKITLWETATGRELGRFVLDSPLWDKKILQSAKKRGQKLVLYAWGVAFHPHEKVVALSCSDNTFRLYQVPEGKLVARWKSAHSFPAKMSFTTDGKELFATHNDELVIHRWEVKTGKFQKKIGRFFQAIGTLSNRGKWVASSGKDYKLRVWNGETGEVIAILNGHKERVKAVAIHPTLPWVATASIDGSIRLWDWEKEAMIQEWKGFVGAVSSMAWADRGHSLITGTYQGEIRKWRLAPHQPYKTLIKGRKEIPRAMIYHPRLPIWAVTAHRKVEVYFRDRPKPVILEGHPEYVKDLAFEPTRESVRLFTVDLRGNIYRWKIDQGKGFGGSYSPIAISQDGRYLATTGIKDGNKVQVWDLVTGKMVIRQTGPKRSPKLLEFTPDGNYLLMTGYSSIIQVWDWRKGKLEGDLEVHYRYITAMAISKLGYMATCGRDRYIHVWDIKQRKVFFTLPRTPKSIKCLAFSPAGNILLVASIDGIVELWEVNGQVMIHRFQSDRWPISVALSHDQKFLLLSSHYRKNKIAIWKDIWPLVSNSQGRRTHQIKEGVRGRKSGKGDKAFDSHPLGYRADLSAEWVQEQLAKNPIALGRFLFEREVGENLALSVSYSRPRLWEYRKEE